MINQTIQKRYEQLRTLYKEQGIFHSSKIPGAAIIVPPENHYAIDRQSPTFRTFFILDPIAKIIYYIEENTVEDYDYTQNNIRISGGCTAKGWVSGYDPKVILWVQELDKLIKSRDKIIGED